MELFNFYTAYTQLRELYGVELTPDQFESIGLIGWSKIGNKNLTLYNKRLDIEDGLVTLPCDIEEIEAVTSDRPDYQSTSPMQESWSMIKELYAEQYIDFRKGDRAQVYTRGKFIKYDRVDPTHIRIHQKTGTVNLLYRTEANDTDGLPFLNVKEIDAIAAYCAYADMFKKGLVTRDRATLEASNMIKEEWLRLCNHARTPMSMSQNDFDAIGDALTSWDRKKYGKSFKPIR